MKKAISLLLCLAVMLSFSACDFNKYPIDITESLENLGVNCIDTWGNGSAARVVSRNPYDMINYQGKIFVSGGNYGDNTGGVPLNYYQNGSDTFTETSVIFTEEVDEFYIYDGILYCTEIDPKWGGHADIYYFDGTDDEWKYKNEVLKNCIHCFDMESYNGSLFFCGSDSTEGKISSIAVMYRVDESVDSVTADDVKVIPYYDCDGNLLTHENMYVEYDIPGIEGMYSAGIPRFYEMFVFKGNLYALIEGAAEKFDGLYIYDAENECFRYDDTTDMNSVFRQSDFGYNDDGIILHDFEYGKKAYFIMNSTAHTMYSSEDLNTYEKVVIPGYEDAEIHDCVFIDGVPHILASVKGEEGYENYLFSTADFTEFKLKYYFSSLLAARSFEYSEGQYYFGLGFSYTHVMGAIDLPENYELCGTVLRYNPKRK